MIDQLKPLLGKLALFSQKRMGFKRPPKLFLRNDSQNSQQALGKTAFYDPNDQSVTLFVHGRHPKDILRSFAHELVHHCQNERGDLSPDKITASGANYAQECPHMRKMEKEAYLQGNMCFRDWEDTLNNKDNYIIIKIAESKFLKENKTMTTKITKEFLKETIRKILAEQAPVISMPAATGEKGLDAHKAVIKQYEQGGKISGVSKADYDRARAAVAAASKKKPEARPAFPDPKKAKKGYEAFAQGALEEEVAEEAIEEGGCGSHKKGDGPCPACGKMHEEVELEENEELEEASDKDGDGHVVPDWADQDDNDPEVGPKVGSKKPKSESKIQTPEQENSLYENRFAPRNNRLFEKLVKEWTK